MALRPDMWFRLARLVGPNHPMLHDDFYLEDGFADQPDIEFDEKEYKKYLVKRGGPYNTEAEYVDDLLTRGDIFMDSIDIPDNLSLFNLELLLYNEINSTKSLDILYSCFGMQSSMPFSHSLQNYFLENWQKYLNDC